MFFIRIAACGENRISGATSSSNIGQSHLNILTTPQESDASIYVDISMLGTLFLVLCKVYFVWGPLSFLIPLVVVYSSCGVKVISTFLSFFYFYLGR